jgi:hypothetical protein
MGKIQLNAGDRIYWEITDSLGRKFQGIGHIDENITFQWLENFAHGLSKPVRIDIKKIEDESKVYLLAPATTEPIPTQEVGKSN